MIQAYTNPLLLDFIRVTIDMPQNERETFEATTGEKYDVDSIAVGNFMVAGPKWVIKNGDKPLCVGGFAPLRPGVWRDFMINSPEAWSLHWFPITRICRRMLDAMFTSGQAHRLECVTTAHRVQKHPCIERWYSAIGYEREAVLRGYCADGSDAVMFSKVSHVNRQ
jgi:hypothetical protein